MSLRYKSEDFENLSDKIEVQILISKEGVSYCLFEPSFRLFPYTPISGASFDNYPSPSIGNYIMSDCGYPESYPSEGEEI